MIQILTVVFESLWFLPLFLRQGKKDAVPKCYTIFALLLGATVGIALAVLLGLGKVLCSRLGLNSNTGTGLLLFCLINAGIAEEGSKFLCGELMLLRAKPVRKLDYILIFGGAAIGFAALESFLYASSDPAAFLRCIFPLHLMWQMMMGEHLYEYRKAVNEGNRSRCCKEAFIAFAVPVLMHTVNDYIVFESGNILTELQQTHDYTAFSCVFGIILPCVWLIGLILFCILEEKKAMRYVRESRTADEAAGSESSEPPTI